MLLVCVLDKIGTFGMLRFCLGLFPEASEWATPVVVILALISIVYGALVAIGQDDVLRLIGLTSLSHFGFIVLGIFVLNSNGGSGAILYMVNHGIGTAALFLIAGYLIRRTGTPLISRMGGQEKVTPVLAGTFLVAGLAACGLPGLAPFVSEMLVIISAFDHAWWAGAIAVTGIVLAAIYILWMYQRTMTGPEPVPQVAGTGDLERRELGAVVPLLVGLLTVRLLPDAAARRDQSLRRRRPDPGRGLGRRTDGALRHCGRGRFRRRGPRVNEFVKPTLEYAPAVAAHPGPRLSPASASSSRRSPRGGCATWSRRS